MNNKNEFHLIDKESLSFLEIDNSYTAFDITVNFLAGICSTNFMLSFYFGNSKLYEENHYVFFESRTNATNRIYYFFPHDIFKYLIKNTWPHNLKLFYKPKEFPDSKSSENAITGFVKVFLGLGQSAFIQFWETIKHQVILKYGNHPQDWPNILQFGWIIRNALAHNFIIEINNKAINNVTWYRLSFGNSTNGIDISEKLMFIELIQLMVDIETFLHTK